MPDRDSDWPPRSPDPLAEIRDLVDQVRRRFGSEGDGRGRWRVSPWVVLPILVLLYLASGIYTVAPDERGVVLRFGRAVRETGPGPHYHLPWPIEEVLKPSVTRIRKEEVGFRTVAVGPPARYREVEPEALMLTGDENIVKLEFIVQYKVEDRPDGVRNFLFNVRDPQGTVRDAAESAMREVVGRTPIDDVLTEGKEAVQVQTQELLQQILDRYEAGIRIVTVKLQDVDPPDQVSDAFKDVISAQQDKERMINEARGYANDILPKARGQAAQLVNEAEGYREAKIREARGEAARFVALQEEYAKAREVTRIRLYLETMQEVLPKVKKVVIDEVAGERVVPYLPLESLLRRGGEGP
ncbi:MAG: HflK protein [Candidatus Binatia bacterium]|nr:MAG: HflK protein [Candidatus Binatia bacterium]